MRSLLVFVLLVCSSHLFAQEKKADSTDEQKKRIEELKKQIEDKKSELAKLETELSKLMPVKVVQYIWASDLQPNTAGRFGGATQQAGRGIEYAAPIRVEKVIDEKRMIVSVYRSIPKGTVPPPQQLVLVKNIDTKNMADGKVIEDPGIFLVLGTEKVDGKTLFAVEPYNIKK